ncbi:MAG TPA: transposase, partial [Gaiellaceae bacterium]|nr:transposase [Gaiellaceae bacterium]
MLHPRPGVDYPESWRELLAWFPDDAACLAYLERLRWPEGFVC